MSYRRPTKGQRFRLKSVLGEHSDHERPRLRAELAARLPERLPGQDTVIRQHQARTTMAHMLLAAKTFHAKHPGNGLTHALSLSLHSRPGGRRVL